MRQNDRGQNHWLAIQSGAWRIGRLCGIIDGDFERWPQFRATMKSILSGRVDDPRVETPRHQRGRRSWATEPNPRTLPSTMAFCPAPSIRLYLVSSMLDWCLPILHLFLPSTFHPWTLRPIRTRKIETLHFSPTFFLASVINIETSFRLELEAMLAMLGGWWRGNRRKI